MASNTFESTKAKYLSPGLLIALDPLIFSSILAIDESMMVKCLFPFNRLFRLLESSRMLNVLLYLPYYVLDETVTNSLLFLIFQYL